MKLISKKQFQGQKNVPRSKIKTRRSKKTTKVKKAHLHQKQNVLIKKMEFIYQKESNLGKENNFTIEISEKKNNVEKEKFIGGDDYHLSSLDLKLKDQDITK